MINIRPTIDVAPAAGGWPAPWNVVGELAEVLPAACWTLVGGLMTQLHTIHHGIGVVRTTNDVDIVWHIETQRGIPNKVASALECVGFSFLPSIDKRNELAHRFVRGRSTVDLVAGASHEDQVDVLMADHPAPRVVSKLRGYEMVRIEGGIQALCRIINARLETSPGIISTISVPRPFGALILKAAAYTTDSRDPDRHIYDAAALLACIEDPIAERNAFSGSERSRVNTLVRVLDDSHPAWRALPDTHRTQAQLTLNLLADPGSNEA